MNSHKDISQSEQDNAIDRNLREAYQQVQYSEEWAARVLRTLASESVRQDEVAKTGVSGIVEWALGRSTWRRTASFAATIVLASLGTYWLLATSRRPDQSDAVDAEFAKRVPGSSVNRPQDRLEMSLDDRDDLEIAPKGLMQTESITGESGFLAAKLSDDPEFEIYMVLPTNELRKF